MNIVYLSPHFPHHYHKFCKKLKSLNANVLAIGDVDHDHLEPEVKDGVSEYYRIDDLHDYDSLLRACGYFTHKYGSIDRIESLNEYWLTTEARLRDDFNVAGIRGREVDPIRRKSLMKEKFRSAGIAVAAGQLATTLDKARKLVQEAGYPLVAKPDAGVGALDTFRIKNDQDLEVFFKNKPEKEYILEGFVNGDIVSFDGLTDADGKLVFFTAHRFSRGIMDIINKDLHMDYTSMRAIPPALEKAGRACVAAFEVRERFFHIEFFETASGSFVALEVNMRPPGGYTTDMFNYGCDIDVYDLWAKTMINGVVPLEYERKYHCCYISRKNHYNYLHSHDDIMAGYGKFIMEVGNVPGVFSTALGNVGYIFRSADMDKIRGIIRFVHAHT